MRVKNNSMNVKKISKKNVFQFQNLVKNHYPKKNHILSKNKQLVNFYYNFGDQKNTNLVGLYKKKKLIAAIGLIPTTNWDKKLKKDYFIAFLLKEKSNKTSSLSLWHYIYKKIKPNLLVSMGINLKTSGKIFEKLGKIQPFSHHYINNPTIKSKLATNLNSLKKNKVKQYEISELKLEISNKIYFLPNCNYVPEKSKNYFINKYLKNPFYNYFVINFYDNRKLVFFFICRKINIKKYNSQIIRVVDFCGQIPKDKYIKNVIEKYLIDKKIAYLDFLSFGIKDDILSKIGFLKKSAKQKIPNYFEPFIDQDTDLNCAILNNTYKKKILLVKGDGDQERPNKI